LNNTKKAAKPTKLKPLTSKSSNLAISLLEEDKSKPTYLEGVPNSAELDAEIKSYLDTNQIFKQLKSAFDPTTQVTSLSLVEDKPSSTAERKKRASKATLEPIQEEQALVSAGLADDGRQRSKKINDLLNKVKKATQKKSKEDPAAILALPGTQVN
jgi:hypothetical protein